MCQDWHIVKTRSFSDPLISEARRKTYQLYFWKCNFLLALWGPTACQVCTCLLKHTTPQCLLGKAALLIPINLSSEQDVGSQSWSLKFERDLTLCLQLTNVYATVWLLSILPSHPPTSAQRAWGEAEQALWNFFTVKAAMFTKYTSRSDDCCKFSVAFNCYSQIFFWGKEGG